MLSESLSYTSKMLLCYITDKSLTRTDLSDKAADPKPPQMYIPETERCTLKCSKTTSHWMVSFNGYCHVSSPAG